MSVPRLGKGENVITVTLDNPDILNKCGLDIEYCWKEKNLTTGTIIEKTEKRAVVSSPMKYKIVCGNEVKLITRYVKMIVPER